MSGKTYPGGCACGAVRYVAIGEPVAELHCQCVHCRMRSGTGHSSYLVFAGAGTTTVTGEPTTWRVAGDSGAVKIHAFCPTCGTPTHLTFANNPEVTAIHAGSLDAPGDFHPSIVTYGSRGLAWDRPDASLTVFETGPGA